MSGELPDYKSVHHSAQTKGHGKERVTTHYIDIPLCFDCETYSFTIINEKGEREKRAVMWAWGLAVGDICYMGRTWPEFVGAVGALVDRWELTPEHRCIIWVHNLSYDFQFFRKWFQWEKVFALSSREVCYALTVDGVEFRCSYILTGYSLEKVGEHLASHSIKKLVGTIDYDIPRHPATRLTESEISYLEHDCLVVTAHIAEQIEAERGLALMPLTKTGYVRRDVRRACFRDPTREARSDPSKKRYMEFIHGLTLDRFVYDSLYLAFAGGFTHASPYHSGEVMEGVSSYDFASAYPSVMCSELFPVTPPEVLPYMTNDEFERTLQKYLCVFTVTLWNVRPKINYDHYLSSSHCYMPKGSRRQLDNGRVVWADELTTTITNVDWEIIIRCYDCDRYEVTGLIRWGRGYLPKPIVESTIRYFQEKTKLKGVEGKEQEYMTAKENLNSIYGMMVQNPLRPHVPYDLEKNAWGDVGPDGRRVLEVPLTDQEKLEALEGYNESQNRFTYYAWGVYITAYCRKNLWKGILHFREDYCYADTDSLKVLDGRSPEHLAYIEKHNTDIQKKIRKCLAWHGLDPELSAACTPTGKRKELGVWEYEGTYSRFKTLGAKRYMIEEDGKINITVSGVNKKTAVPYILSVSDDPFDFFSEGMVIPPGHAGKMIPFYGDAPITGLLRDRDGVCYEYLERSYVYMEPGGYSLSLGEGYAGYLDYLRKGLV